MDLEHVFQYLPIAIFALIWVSFAGWLILCMFRYGGFKGAMFGASIHETLGSISLRAPRWVRLSVKVHALSPHDPDKAVGLEIVGKTLASYQMTPLVLTVSEAEELAALLDAALKKRSAR